MKKTFFLLAVIFVLSVSCTGAKTEAEESSSERKFYIPKAEKIATAVKLVDYLQAWDTEQISVSDEHFAKIYATHVSGKTFSSMVYEQFSDIGITMRSRHSLKTTLRKINLPGNMKKSY